VKADERCAVGCSATLGSQKARRKGAASGKLPRAIRVAALEGGASLHQMKSGGDGTWQKMPEDRHEMRHVQDASSVCDFS
jgi:hypothetical protein